MFCGNCGAQIEDGSVFCPECGERISGEENVVAEENVVEKLQQQSENISTSEDMQEENEPAQEKRFCPNCGVANESGIVFCYNCGTPFGSVLGAEQKPKKKLPIVPILSGVAAIVVVATGVIVGFKLFQKTSAPVYLKGNEIMSLYGNRPYEFGEEFYDESLAEDMSENVFFHI